MAYLCSVEGCTSGIEVRDGDYPVCRRHFLANRDSDRIADWLFSNPLPVVQQDDRLDRIINDHSDKE